MKPLFRKCSLLFSSVHCFFIICMCIKLAGHKDMRVRVDEARTRRLGHGQNRHFSFTSSLHQLITHYHQISHEILVFNALHTTKCLFGTSDTIILHNLDSTQAEEEDLTPTECMSNLSSMITTGKLYLLYSNWMTSTFFTNKFSWYCN